MSLLSRFVPRDEAGSHDHLASYSHLQVLQAFEPTDLQDLEAGLRDLHSDILVLLKSVYQEEA